ncbi:MAG: hypothetical protein A2Y69_15090 [Candidatus Aminicenantes bacterium RBG_13_59_9]|nr:MAG: hypothetical protein A2Y69_15090 [Candidatus Aminicenantes bacterium RBG_13_59_9]
MLAEFNKILQVNFIAPLRAANITITPELRAKCIAYQLHRQLGLLGEFESDREAGRHLLEAVRKFVVGASSPGIWAIVESGLQGQYTEEINRLLGGSAYVPPIISSLDGIVSKRKSLDFDPDKYYAHAERDRIMGAAQDFFLAIREQRFEDVQKYVAGKMAEEWPQTLKAMKEKPDVLREMTSFSEKLEWKLFSAALAETSPPLAQLIFGLNDIDKWRDYEMYIILDAGHWRVVKFDRL